MDEKKMPKIAMGAWAWGNDGTFGDQYAAADLKDVYATAMKQGLNLWDAAVVYGMGTSENILGELTKDTPQADLILSTKFTPQIEDGTAEAMQNMLNGSKERLHILDSQSDGCGKVHPHADSSGQERADSADRRFQS